MRQPIETYHGPAPDASLDPIDVGFDPRAHGMVCTLPADASVVIYQSRAERVEDRQRMVVSGERAEIEAALTEAGYLIRWEDRS